jgi:hypothetical protein
MGVVVCETARDGQRNGGGVGLAATGDEATMTANAERAAAEGTTEAEARHCADAGWSWLDLAMMQEEEEKQKCRQRLQLGSDSHGGHPASNRPRQRQAEEGVAGERRAQAIPGFTKL